MSKLKNEEPNQKPVPIRMGELRPVYQREAVKLDRSMHWLILQALKEYSKSFNKSK